MMKVKLNSSIYIAHLGSFPVKATVELDDKIAKNLIDRNMATLVIDEEPKKELKVKAPKKKTKKEGEK